MKTALALPRPRLHRPTAARRRRAAPHATERAAYSVPWTEGNLHRLHRGRLPRRAAAGADGRLIGYWLAMPGVDEMHLLNITVAPGSSARAGPCACWTASSPACAAGA